MVYHNKCCIPHCQNNCKQSHVFPNPTKDIGRFKKWMDAIKDPELMKMDPILVFNRKRVCHKHFEEQYFSIQSRHLFSHAVPTLYLSAMNKMDSSELLDAPSTLSTSKDISSSSVPNSDSEFQEVSNSSSSVEDHDYSEGSKSLRHEETVGFKVLKVEEMLIICVKARPPIWDFRLPLNQRSKEIKDGLWSEIYRAFGNNPQFSINYLMNKWKYLKYTFFRLKVMYDKGESTGKNWQYYDSMSFLKDSFKTREMVDNHPSISSDEHPPAPVNQMSTDEKKPKICKTTVKTAPPINAVNKMNQSVLHQPVQRSVNPICIRISELLSYVPEGERTSIEIKLLQLAYEGARHYLSDNVDEIESY